MDDYPYAEARRDEEMSVLPVNCRTFAKTVWIHKVLLVCENDFDAERLHEIIHANEEHYYDDCPGEKVVTRWFKQFSLEVC